MFQITLNTEAAIVLLKLLDAGKQNIPITEKRAEDVMKTLDSNIELFRRQAIDGMFKEQLKESK